MDEMNVWLQCILIEMSKICEINVFAYFTYQFIY